MSLYELAGRITRAGDTVAEAAATIRRLDRGPRAFGGDAPGRLGELGRAMHRQHETGLAARAGEAGGYADGLLDLARDVRLAADRYDRADHRQGYRHQSGAR